MLNLRTLRTEQKAHKDEKKVECMLQLENGLLATGQEDSHLVEIFNTTTELLVKCLRGHLSPVSSLLLLRKSYLASGSRDASDGLHKIWHLDHVFSYPNQSDTVIYGRN
jgi:hypothetical protein